MEVSEVWRVDLEANETANDSDKTFTIPSTEEWQILTVWVELTTTATIGNRQLEIQIQDAAADVIYSARPNVVQAASLTRNYAFAPSVEPMSAFIDTDFISTPIPPIFLAPGWIIRVFDNNAVDAGADDMIIQLTVARRSIIW
jgi:hypothetical protein